MAIKQKILIVDDDNNIAELISLYLTKECYDTKIVNDGEEALHAFEHYNPNLILLDLMLPGIDGYQVCREIRAKSNVPIIMLSAKGEIFDKVLGLELGADDYLCKPFSMRELIARIHVILRRFSGGREKSAGEENILCHENLKLNLRSYMAFVGQENLELTVTEFRLLEAFIKNQDVVLSREQLISICYPEDIYLNDRAIDCHIKRLRKKLSVDEKLPEKIQTVYGAGYRWTGLLS